MSNHPQKERKNHVCVFDVSIWTACSKELTHHILKKLNTSASATAYLECESNKETNPETDDVKEISYYVFEKLEECYIKMERWWSTNTQQEFKRKSF